MLAAPVHVKAVVQFLTDYYYRFSIPVQELRDEGTVNQDACWSAVETFRKRGHSSADLVWA